MQANEHDHPRGTSLVGHLVVQVLNMTMHKIFALGVHGDKGVCSGRVRGKTSYKVDNMKEQIK